MYFYNIVVYLIKIFINIFYKLEVIGLENIPNHGSSIIAPNHKSNLDPLFIAAAIDNRKIVGVAKQELFDFKPLGFILNKLNMIPINRDKPDLSTIKKILKELKSGNIIGIFPEGTRVKGNSFGDAKAGLSLLAIRGKVSVVPISIITNYKPFSKVTIYIDTPIFLEEHYNKKMSSKEYKELSQNILNIVIENYYIFS